MRNYRPLSKFIAATRRQRAGFTLPEVLITATIIIALAGATTWALIGLITISGQTGERLRQASSSELLSGTLESLISATQPADLGRTIDSEKNTGGSPNLVTYQGLIPPSLAGDQFLFTANQRCHRLIYIERRQELWQTTASQCSLLLRSDGLLRGPNQTIDGQQQFAANSPYYDPLLDGLLTTSLPPGTQSLLLAQGLLANNDQPLFSYFDFNRQPLDVDPQAELGSNNFFYRGPNAAQIPAGIFYLQLNGQFLGQINKQPEEQLVGSRWLKQNFFPGQSCQPGEVSG